MRMVREMVVGSLRRSAPWTAVRVCAAALYARARRRTKQWADGKGIPVLSVELPEGNFSRGERLSEKRHGRNGKGRHIRRPFPNPKSKSFGGRCSNQSRSCSGDLLEELRGLLERVVRCRGLGSPVSSRSSVSSRASRTVISGSSSDSSAGTSSGSNGSGSKAGGGSVMLGGLAVRPRLGGLQLVGRERVVERERVVRRVRSSAEAGLGRRPAPAAEGLLLLALDLVVGGAALRFSSRCSRMASSRLPMDGYH